MAIYIANKPCRFGGKAYLIGEKIPGDKILPRRLGGLLRMGVIVEGADEAEHPAESPDPVTAPAGQPKTETVEPKEEAPKKSKK